MFLAWKKKALASLAHWSALDFCGQLDQPGVKTDDPRMVDWSRIPTTIDQQRIELVLAERDLAGARVLHVGVGDSGLARRFHGRCRSIDGITVAENERLHADELKLPNYKVYRVNKFSREFTLTLEPGYQLIIDNNPASYACCAYHFAAMMENYRWAVAPGGALLTDQRGLHWVAGDRRWRMKYEDLAAVGKRFGMTATRITQDVFSLRRD